MKGDALRTTVLSVKMIPNVDSDMIKRLELPEGHRSIGMITTDCDDVGYTAIDEATKKADVKVAYAKSFYGGADNASTKLAGEFIGILSGPNPAEVKSGVNAAIEFIENDACFYSANDDDSIPYYAHCVSRTGSFLSDLGGIPEGEAMAYLIAPPIEAIYALDAALKAADVEMVEFFGPPSETNFGGGLLTGSQSACKAACDAFADAVIHVADNPLKY
ncbi:MULTISPECIES: ethanolamine utilization microcompartment protein EutL [Desulfoluna]|uniref:Ethanolamine utilization protein EutL n=2 Tax=Desulfoluna TaxID=497721 RepID=A0A1G5EA84_9BACT|nr:MULTISPECIES: ethanolamine utilization microcompartment protein EutL [Desulfoluna]SCY23872.1 ethanolamine utilization protein EutL [Desulfoluna spongiiphila]VFQ45021.1 ethanolamine utilization protein eutl [Desulfoluna butyratoxydans]VVS91679.1 polyhedral organelle shell protein eutl/pdub type [Desulfoluna spongiiphila]